MPVNNGGKRREPVAMRRPGGRGILFLLVPAAACLVLSAAPAGEQAGLDPGAMQALFGMAARGGGGGGGGGRSGESRVDLPTLQSLLSKERNVLIEEQGDVIVVDGRVSSLSAKRRLEKILARYENILDLTEFIQDEDAIIARAGYLQQKIHDRLNASYDPERAFVPPQRVEYDIVGNGVVVVGELNNQYDIDAVSRIVNTYERASDSQGGGAQQQRGQTQDGADAGPAVGGEHLGIRRQPIELSVVFAKINKTDQQSLGATGLTTATVTIPTITGIPGSATNPVSNPLKVFNKTQWSASDAIFSLGAGGKWTMDFSSLLNSGAILSRPHLSALNGTEARFHSGGQVGIQNTTQDTNTTEWKDYGTILTVTPTLTTDGRIHLKISLEFSLPIGDPKDGEFMTFQHSSEAIVSVNEGAILSGMVQEIRNRGREGTPGLRKIPILGYFFGNRNHSFQNEELLLVVIPKAPEIVDCGPFITGKDTVRLINGVVCNVNKERNEERLNSEKPINKSEPYSVYPPEDSQFRLGNQYQYIAPQYNQRPGQPAGTPPVSQGGRTMDEKLMSDLVVVK